MVYAQWFNEGLKMNQHKNLSTVVLSNFLSNFRSWNKFVCHYFSANNPDVLDKLEGLVALWSKVIEQVLAESEQVMWFLFKWLLLILSIHVTALSHQKWVKYGLEVQVFLHNYKNFWCLIILDEERSWWYWPHSWTWTLERENGQV